MIEIQVLMKKTREYTNWTVDIYHIIAPIPQTSFNELSGADPGTTNLGLCLLFSMDDGEDRAILWQVKLQRSDNPVSRMILATQIMNEFADHNWNTKMMTIENSAFGASYRQVELAEQRAAIAMWCVKHPYPVQMVVPMKIRKTVFGSGKIKAHEAWQLAGIPKNKQPNDALAALSCAYYGMMKGE